MLWTDGDGESLGHVGTELPLTVPLSRTCQHLLGERALYRASADRQAHCSWRVVPRQRRVVAIGATPVVGMPLGKAGTMGSTGLRWYPGFRTLLR